MFEDALMKQTEEPDIDAQLAAFGRNVSDARKRAGLSQTKLCEGNPLDRAALSLLEKAHRSPDMATLLKVARALQLTPVDLLGDVGSDGAREHVPRAAGRTPREPGKCFGHNLRWARERAGFSQEGVAYEAKVDRAAISLYESGSREPNLRTVLKLARALQLHPSVLLQDVR